ncbi:MAG: sigma-70 family RNA polymerase sigma factor [Planctomycetes bacterium]|nr:sigma-70 family RNA polymerase sigma factor [Planctomycetota bacterium]
MSPLETKSSKLFRQFQTSGDSEVLGRTYDLIAPDFLTLAVHITGCADAAEDLVQEVFLDAIEQGGEWAPGVALETWLAELLAHRLETFERTRGQAPVTADLDEAMALTMRWTPLSEVQQCEVLDQLNAAIAHLPAKYLAVVQLGILDGLNSKEIGLKLGRSPATVRSQLARGLDKLRSSLPVALGSFLLITHTGQARGATLGADAALQPMRARFLEHATRVKATSSAPASIATRTILQWAAVAMLAIGGAFWAMDSSEHTLDAVHASAATELSRKVEPSAQALVGPAVADSSRREPAVLGDLNQTPKRAHVFGRVLDAGGKPIEGAAATLFTWRKWDSPEGAPEIDGESIYGWRVHTGPSGEFSFDVQLPETGNPTLNVQSGPNYTVSDIWFNTTFCNQAPLWSGENAIGPVYLQHAGQISGTLLTDAGLPAYPAYIIISPGANPTTGSMIATQPDGSFQMGHLLAGQQELIVQYKSQVRATESVLIKKGGPALRLHMRMPPTRSLRVDVSHSDGSPLAGAMIRFEPMGTNSKGDMRDIGLRTDRNGSAQVQVLNQQKGALFVSLKGFASEERFYRPKADQGFLKVRMTRTYTQMFRAVDFHTGEPLKEYWLVPQILEDGQWANSRASQREEFENSGAIAISTRDGEWVNIWSPGYHSKRLDPRSCREEIAVVSLKPLMKIAGRVMLNGQPVSHAKLELAGSTLRAERGAKPEELRALFTSLGNAMAWLETDSNGYFEFTAFTTSNLTYRLRVQAGDGHAVERWFRLNEFQGDTAELGALQLEEAGSVAVSVLAPTGMDPTGLAFLLDLPHGATIGRVNSHGKFKLNGIVPGKHKLHLRKNPGLAQDSPGFAFEIVAGKATQLAIDLRPLALSYQDLQLLDNGKPMVDCKVFFAPKPPLSAGNATQWKGGYFGTTDDQGRLYGRAPAAGWAQVWVYEVGKKSAKRLAKPHVDLRHKPQGLITVTF